MAVIVYGAKQQLYAPAGSVAGRVSALAACLLLGAAVYLLAAKVTGCRELSLLRESLRSRQAGGGGKALPTDSTPE